MQQPATPAKHAPLLEGSCGENTGRKKKQTSDVWNSVKRLKANGPDPRVQLLLLDEMTHICRMPLKDGEEGFPGHCNHAVRLTRQGSPTGPWLLTKAGRHLCDAHPDCEYSKQVSTRESGVQNAKVLQLLNFNSPASLGQVPMVGQQPLPTSFVLTKDQQELSAQAQHCCQKCP